MTTSRITVRALAGLALVVGFTTAASAQPAAVTAEWALKQQPKQPGVNISTPTPDQVPRCKVSPIPNPKEPGKAMGYLVTDGAGNPVRQFVSYDNKNFNIVAFYVDGVEAYREVYPPGTNEPYQFRWLGPNGTKWGLDRNRDFTVDEWVVISPEEASQELLRAVVARDAKRLEALLINAENLKSIGLPAADADRIKARAAAAAKRLTDAADALKLSDKAKWIHAEYGIPQTRPADSFGSGTEDYTSYKNGTVLVEDGGKTVFLQTGELVQVGRSWKLVDGPSAGPATGDVAGGGQLVTPEIKELVDQLNAIDQKGPGGQTVEALAAFNAQRANILEGILAKIPDKPELKETLVAWVKMLIDAHAGAAEGGKPDSIHLRRLKDWRDALIRGNHPTAASYAAFRLIVAENSVALVSIKNQDELGPVQEKWRASLEGFIKEYGTSADAPEAAWRLAMAWELSGGKDADAKAKQWFEHLVKNYANHAHALKAAGAIKRLDCEGKPLELTGPLLSNAAQQFTAAQKDKVVVVYYWAGWSQSLPDDAKKLAALAKEYGPKGLEIVTVSLDHDAKAATEAAARVGLPGTHLFAPGGLDGSPLAAAYGILAPPHVMVAGKDTKVANRNAPLAGLEEELKKLLEAK
jgi:thiol-disulfide isomerase/thioredoxin